MNSELPVDSADKREFLYPINRPALWKLYKKAEASYWPSTEVDMSRDAAHYRDKLNEKERHLIDHILSFFAIADDEVNINIIERFLKDIPYREAQNFYGMQVAIENIHQQVYADSIEALVRDSSRREKLFAAVREIPTISRMIAYIREIVGSAEPLQVRILRMACVEGIFFHGAFCVIYWFRSRGLMPGLGQANELIARDEGLHTDFALELFRMFETRPDTETVRKIVSDAVDIAAEFVNGALPEGLPEMNSSLMLQYIQRVADVLVSDIGYAPIFGVENPFSFMNQINMPTHTRFFENKNTQYKKGGNTSAIAFDVDV